MVDGGVAVHRSVPCDQVGQEEPHDLSGGAAVGGPVAAQIPEVVQTLKRYMSPHAGHLWRGTGMVGLAPEQKRQLTRRRKAKPKS